MEHLNDYRLELRDDTNKLIGVTEPSQNSSLLNIIKGHYNGQKMKILNINLKETYLNIYISGK